MIWIQPGEEKLESMNALREFCLDTFGVRPGLKETLAFLDTMVALQEPLQLRQQFNVVSNREAD